MGEREDFPDRVMTIHNYFDGLLLGVATLVGAPCIYEGDLWEGGDPYLYYLTPIDPQTLEAVMAEWERWIRWVEERGTAQGWLEAREFELGALASTLPQYRMYRRYARFWGRYDNFHSHIDSLFVRWSVKPEPEKEAT